jgi:hypothetical protein
VQSAPPPITYRHHSGGLLLFGPVFAAAVYPLSTDGGGEYGWGGL